MDSPEWLMTLFVWSMADIPPNEVKAITRAVFICSENTLQVETICVPFVISVIPDRRAV